MPAAWVSRAPANRMLSSRSRGTPSRRELDVSNCAIVASGFAYGERSMVVSHNRYTRKGFVGVFLCGSRRGYKTMETRELGR
jgi:hypothetical protein